MCAGIPAGIEPAAVTVSAEEDSPVAVESVFAADPQPAAMSDTITNVVRENVFRISPV